MRKIVASFEYDVSPGPPYQPVMRSTGLFYVGQIKNWNRKKYYLASLSNAASKTWISDEEAKNILESWKTK